MMYKCLKCGNEFEAKLNVECPECGAKDWDCEPLRRYRLTHPETPVEVPAAGEK